MHRAAQRAMKDRRTARGVCIACGLAKVSRFKRCVGCREYEASLKRVAYARVRDLRLGLESVALIVLVF